MQDKRAHSRRLMQEDAFLSDDTASSRHPVVLLDIARLGICFTNPDLLAKGSVHTLVFTLPGSAQLHQALIEVVHSTTQGVPMGYRVGARFLEIHPDTANLISELVATLIDA